MLNPLAAASSSTGQKMQPTVSKTVNGVWKDWKLPKKTHLHNHLLQVCIVTDGDGVQLKQWNPLTTCATTQCCWNERDACVYYFNYKMQNYLEFCQLVKMHFLFIIYYKIVHIL